MKSPGAFSYHFAIAASAVCLAWALERYARVETVGFDYGQRHGVEMTQRPVVRERMAALLPEGARLGPDHVLDLKGFGAIGETAMTTDREIELDAASVPPVSGSTVAAATLPAPVPPAAALTSALAVALPFTAAARAVAVMPVV